MTTVVNRSKVVPSEHHRHLVGARWTRSAHRPTAFVSQRSERELQDLCCRARWATVVLKPPSPVDCRETIRVTPDCHAGGAAYLRPPPPLISSEMRAAFVKDVEERGEAQPLCSWGVYSQWSEEPGLQGGRRRSRPRKDGTRPDWMAGNGPRCPGQASGACKSRTPAWTSPAMTPTRPCFGTGALGAHAFSARCRAARGKPLAGPDAVGCRHPSGGCARIDHYSGGSPGGPPRARRPNPTAKADLVVQPCCKPTWSGQRRLRARTSRTRSSPTGRMTRSPIRRVSLRALQRDPSSRNHPALHVSLLDQLETRPGWWR